MFGFDDILMGAAIGGGLNLLTGKNPLQGAAIGGLGGGLLGGLKNANFLQSSAATPIKNAAQFEASMGLPSSAYYAAGGTGMTGANTLGSMGLKTVGETAYNPEYFAGLGVGMPIYKGGQGLLSNATSGLLSNLPDYVTPQNVIGAANLLANQQAPQQMAAPSPSSSVRPGSVQGLNVNYGMAQPIKRRGYA